MGRYANQTIKLDFPDLSEDGDLIYVTIRNPKTVPLDKLLPGAVELDAAGDPDRDAAVASGFEVMAGLVVDWHVYDANVEDGPALGLPATAEALRSLPFEIANAITSKISAVVSPPQ